ncbi:MAG TPA: ABC transporter permease [Candidatus Borkfalkia excrementavium]|uniref:ABC transporter permease n=1 Tax=Candidatus Borkfalkia excrementavium TaxID=2838505 RepID=A0A9D2CH07_9FIRM|nr:ABC transporter permease [Candidatus Borkfalkia excrementavium]
MKKFKRRSARVNLSHFRVLSARYFRQIFTNLATLLPLILEAPVMILILSIVCNADAFEMHSLTQANTTIFVLVVMAGMMGILNSYREICKEREILSREVFGGLDVSAYALSKFIVLSAIGIVQCALLFFGSLPLTGFRFSDPAAGYALCFLAMALTDISVTAVGLYISALLKKSESAILPVLLIIIMLVVFSDSVITLDGAAGWLRYITPSAWGIAVFGRMCGLNGWTEYFNKDFYGYHPLIPLAALAAIALLFLFLTIARLKRTYRQKDQ